MTAINERGIVTDDGDGSIHVWDATTYRYISPCTAAEALRFAGILRRLLQSLDREIVLTAVLGECEPDLLNPVRQEVDRVREFLDGRVAMRSEPSDLRSRGLAVLDAFEDDFEPRAERHSSSPSADVGDTRSVGDGAGGVAAIRIPGANQGDDS